MVAQVTQVAQVRGEASSPPSPRRPPGPDLSNLSNLSNHSFSQVLGPRPKNLGKAQVAQVAQVWVEPSPYPPDLSRPRPEQPE